MQYSFHFFPPNRVSHSNFSTYYICAIQQQQQRKNHPEKPTFVHVSAHNSCLSQIPPIFAKRPPSLQTRRLIGTRCFSGEFDWKGLYYFNFVYFKRWFLSSKMKEWMKMRLKGSSCVQGWEITFFLRVCFLGLSKDVWFILFEWMIKNIYTERIFHGSNTLFWERSRKNCVSAYPKKKTSVINERFDESAYKYYVLFIHTIYLRKTWIICWIFICSVYIFLPHEKGAKFSNKNKLSM